MSWYNQPLNAIAALKNIPKLFNKDQLTQSQTENRSMTAYGAEFEHPAIGLTPLKVHALLTQAEAGNMNAMLALFEDMEERDLHLLAEMSKRKRTVAKLDWSIKAPKNADANEQKYTEVISELIGIIENFEDIITDSLDAIGKGFSCHELHWVREGNVWLINDMQWHVPQRFIIDPFNQRELLLAGNGLGDDEPLWENAWLVHTHKAKSGYLVRGGLHRALVWSYVFKNYSVRDLAEFLEIYGLPLRLGTYPAGATDGEKLTLLRAVMEIGHRAAGIIPQGMMIDFKEAAKGSSDPFMDMIKWCEMSQSKAILGGTLTSQADGKSSTNALGKVHEETRLEIRDSDAKQLASSISRDVIGALMRINYPNVSPRRYPKFVFDLAETEDIGVYSEALPKLVSIGMQIPAPWAHKRLGIPMVSGDEPVLSMAQANQPTNQAPLTAQLPAVAMMNQSQTDKSIPAETTAESQRMALENGLDALLSNDMLGQIGQHLTAGMVEKLQGFDSFEEALGYLSDNVPDNPALLASLTQMIAISTAMGIDDQLTARGSNA
nr:MAG TPA: portal [Caudoviricetes sp.]